MRQQVLNGDFTRGRDGVVLRRIGRWRVGGAVLNHGHLRALELRYEFRDGIVEAHLAFFEQHQDSHSADGLRHREGAEEGVLLHGLVRFNVHEALRVEPGDLPFARDQGDGTGDVMRVDVALHRVVDSRKAFLGESDRFGFDRCAGKGQAG